MIAIMCADQYTHIWIRKAVSGEIITFSVFIVPLNLLVNSNFYQLGLVWDGFKDCSNVFLPHMKEVQS